MPKKIVALDCYTLNPGDISWDGFQTLGDLIIHDRTPPAQIVPRSLGAAYILTNKVPFPAETLDQLPDLKYIGVLATGYNVVDIEAAKQRNIVVTNVPTYGTDSVAQHAFALIFALLRPIAIHNEAVHSGQWSSNIDWCFALSPITELTGNVLGIVGIGRIGLAVARIGAAMGMRIVAHDEFPPDATRLGDLKVDFVGMDEVFVRADVICLHCPLTDKTYRLVNAQRLATMKSTAILINTSRGPLVDNQALATALTNGTIAGAGLDVLDVEPPPRDNPLLGVRNCVITPHIAWYAQASRQRLMDIAVENLRSFQSGQPTNCVS